MCCFRGLASDLCDIDLLFQVHDDIVTGKNLAGVLCMQSIKSVCLV